MASEVGDLSFFGGVERPKCEKGKWNFGVRFAFEVFRYVVDVFE